MRGMKENFFTVHSFPAAVTCWLVLPSSSINFAAIFEPPWGMLPRAALHRRPVGVGSASKSMFSRGWARKCVDRWFSIFFFPPLQADDTVQQYRAQLNAERDVWYNSHRRPEMAQDRKQSQCLIAFEGKDRERERAAKGTHLVTNVNSTAATQEPHLGALLVQAGM